MLEILKTTPLIDGHNDLPWALRQQYGNDVYAVDLTTDLEATTRLHTDIARLRAGGVGGQFWSVYVPASLTPLEAVEETFEQIDTAKRIIAAHPDVFGLATTADQVDAVFASGRAFPDALSAGSLAASLGAPLLLVPPTEKLPGTSERFLRDHADRFSMGVVVGGPAAADEYVLAQLDAALQGQPSPAQPREEQPPAEPAAAPQPAPAEPAQPAAAEEDNETFEGDASYYGPGLNGNQTANGETFDMYGMTAAHRTLPFDTIIRVTNLNNGRQVDLRINDRGPYADDRVLDVSYGAAQELQMMDDGVVPVRVEVLSSP